MIIGENRKLKVPKETVEKPHVVIIHSFTAFVEFQMWRLRATKSEQNEQESDRTEPMRQT